MTLIKKFLTFFTAVTVTMCLTITQSSFAQDEQTAKEKPLAKERWLLVEFDASVEAIDYESRDVTLKGPMGNTVTITAGEQVKRLDEIKVGDVVHTAYWTFLRAEFREPNEEEKKNPIVILAEAARAPAEIDPAAAVGAVVKAVVTVIAIDKESREAAIQGPRGGIMIVPVMDDAVLDNLKVGEVAIMTYAEALAMSLDKTE